jgi:hypothetical protein
MGGVRLEPSGRNENAALLAKKKAAKHEKCHIKPRGSSCKRSDRQGGGRENRIQADEAAGFAATPFVCIYIQFRFVFGRLPVRDEEMPPSHCNARLD